MKLLAWNAVIASALTFSLPHAATSQDTSAGGLSIPAAIDNVPAHLSADSILREDPPNHGPSPYASVIHLRGHVELRTCCFQRPQSRTNPTPQRSYVILRADEAEYNADTGQISARGEVRLSFRPVH
jgi:hypothetical protein